jgi:hypothetical protein
VNRVGVTTRLVVIIFDRGVRAGLSNNTCENEVKDEDEVLTVYERKLFSRLRLIDVERCEEEVTMNCKCQRGVCRQL